MNWTCCNCGNVFNETDGDSDERLCFNCMYDDDDDDDNDDDDDDAEKD